MVVVISKIGALEEKETEGRKQDAEDAISCSGWEWEWEWE